MLKMTKRITDGVVSVYAHVLIMVDVVAHFRTHVQVDRQLGPCRCSQTYISKCDVCIHMTIDVHMHVDGAIHFPLDVEVHFHLGLNVHVHVLSDSHVHNYVNDPVNVNV
jgi:hypothetical protein